MYVDGRDPKNPIYIFSKHTNTYLRDEKGSPVLFVGDANEDAHGNLVSSDGNYLVRNQKRVTAQEIHVPSPDTAKTPETPESTPKPTSVASTIIPPTQTHRPVSHYPDTQQSAPVQNTNFSPQPFNSPFANTAHAAPAPVYPPTQTQTIYAEPYRPSREPAESSDNSGTNGLLALIAALLIIIVGGGAGFLVYNITQKDDTATENSTSTETPTTETTIRLPAIAHAHAGHPEIPSGAKQLDIIVTPSGMHHCVLNNPDYLECQTTSWTPKQRYGSNNAVRLTKNETPELVTSSVSGGVTLQYGEVAYNGNWMCGSTKDGITCWSRSSSHGFVMNSNGYQPF